MGRVLSPHVASCPYLPRSDPLSSPAPGAHTRRTAAQCGLPRACGGGAEQSEAEGGTQASSAPELSPPINRGTKFAEGRTAGVFSILPPQRAEGL